MMGQERVADSRRRRHSQLATPAPAPAPTPAPESGREGRGLACTPLALGYGVACSIQLQQIVPDADEAPLPTHFIQTTQQEATEAAAFLALAKDGLDDGFALGAPPDRVDVAGGSGATECALEHIRPVLLVGVPQLFDASVPHQRAGLPRAPSSVGQRAGGRSPADRAEATAE